MDTAIGNLASASTLTGVVPALTNGNGTTFNVDKVDLGGEITENTILTFDPTVLKLIVGDSDTPSLFAFGNLNSDGEARFLVTGVSAANISANGVDITNVDASGSVAITSADAIDIEADGAMNLSAISDVTMQSESAVFLSTSNASSEYTSGLSITPFATMPAAGLNLKKDQDFEVGFFAIESADRKYANIYYGVLNGSNVITDTSRVEANENEVHGRKFITVGGNYNGFHCNTTYSQLEFNKSADDGQASGTVWVLDTNGAALYVGGTLQFRIKNSVPSYADDAAATGAGLVTGDVYKTTTGGSTFLKIVP